MKGPDRCKCKFFRLLEKQCKDRSKENNKQGVMGEVMRYYSCDSWRHLFVRCPHSWEIMEIIEKEATSENGTILDTRGEETMIVPDDPGEF